MTSERKRDRNSVLREVEVSDNSHLAPVFFSTSLQVLECY